MREERIGPSPLKRSWLCPRTKQALGLKMPPTLLVHAAGWASDGHPVVDRNMANADGHFRLWKSL